MGQTMPTSNSNGYVAGVMCAGRVVYNHISSEAFRSKAFRRIPYPALVHLPAIPTVSQCLSQTLL